MSSLQQGRLHFERAEDPALEGYFKVIQSHVLHAGRGYMPCIPENSWPPWVDLVSYAHEHACLARPDDEESLVPHSLASRLDRPYTPLMAVGESRRYWMQTGSALPVAFNKDEMGSRFVHLVDFTASAAGRPLPLRALAVPLQLQRAIVDIAL